MLVRKFPRRTVIILLTAALTLAACNVGATPAPTMDINAINTAAVATAMGQISRRALGHCSANRYDDSSGYICIAYWCCRLTAARRRTPNGLFQ